MRPKCPSHANQGRSDGGRVKSISHTAVHMAVIKITVGSLLAKMRVLLNLKSPSRYRPLINPVPRASAYTYLAFDAIFVGVWKCASVNNFIILGLGLGNRVSIRVRVSFSVSIKVSIRLIRYSAI